MLNFAVMYDIIALIYYVKRNPPYGRGAKSENKKVKIFALGAS